MRFVRFYYFECLIKDVIKLIIKIIKIGQKFNFNFLRESFSFARVKKENYLNLKNHLEKKWYRSL